MADEVCHQTNSEEISLLCQSTFMKIKQALGLLWIVVPLILGACSAVIGYGFVNTRQVTVLDQQQKAHELRLNRLDVDINSKLDFLIQKSKEK